jgi:NAD(P)-dependent dehydrogenase (short-subunit alcohol dehydrogenase family)
VIKVHLKGTFAPSRHAAAYWREESKKGNGPVKARIINTTSTSGIYGNVGQTNYGAAKAGIAAFTIIAARELARYGVTVNAISPSAQTRMTEGLRELSEKERAARDPKWVSPAVVYLASEEAQDITGPASAALPCARAGAAAPRLARWRTRWPPARCCAK